MEAGKFQLKDRLVVKKKFTFERKTFEVGMEGKLIGILDDLILVEWDKDIEGHDGSFSCPITGQSGHCWFIDKAVAYKKMELVFPETQVNRVIQKIRSMEQKRKDLGYAF